MHLLHLRTFTSLGLAGAALSLVAVGCQSDRSARSDTSHDTYAARNPVYSETYGYSGPTGYTWDADVGSSQRSDRQPLKLDNGTQDNFHRHYSPDFADRTDRIPLKMEQGENRYRDRDRDLTPGGYAVSTEVYRDHDLDRELAARPATPPSDQTTIERQADLNGPYGYASPQAGKPSINKTGDALSTIANWPEASKTAAREMIDKYGQPTEITSLALIWTNNGLWKRTLVYRDPIPHNFPMPHQDVLHQFISMKVPTDKFDDLANFDGSVTVSRTTGEVSSMCNTEAMNFVALNLAYDIVTSKKSVEDARAELARLATAVKNGERPSQAQQLQFEARGGNTADPDQPSTNTMTPTKSAGERESGGDRDDR